VPLPPARQSCSIGCRELIVPGRAASDAVRRAPAPTYTPTQLSSIRSKADTMMTEIERALLSGRKPDSISIELPPSAAHGVHKHLTANYKGNEAPVTAASGIKVKYFIVGGERGKVNVTGHQFKGEKDLSYGKHGDASAKYGSVFNVHLNFDGHW
jgi:hypothetical protein